MQPVIHRLKTDAEQSRGFGLAAANRLQSRRDQRSLDVIERHADGDPQRGWIRKYGNAGARSLPRDGGVFFAAILTQDSECSDVDLDFFVGQHERAMDDVLQLPHVPRPAVPDDLATAFGAQSLLFAVLLIELGEEL